MFFKPAAKELKQITHWINSKPLRLANIEHKVILLDFFAYSGVNCRREIPRVINLYNKYKDYGLVVIGIHAPEFEFETIPEYLEAAVESLGIPYLVGMDNEHATWYLYGGKYWPRQVLISQDKKVLLNLKGEGHSHEIEKAIRHALEKEGVDLTRIPFEKEQEKKFKLKQTPQVYAGFFRNKKLGSEYKELEQDYDDTLEEHREGMLYPHGSWKQNYEYLWHDKETDKERNEYLALSFHAQECNVVAMPYNTNKETKIEVRIKGMPVPKQESGDDIFYEGKRSYILVNRPDLYNLFKANQRGDYEVQLLTHEAELCVFSFTFG